MWSIYLTNEFFKSFYFESNVKLQVTFQAFDPEWDDFVDLVEDTMLQRKDKVKVVVTPRLSNRTSERARS